MDLTSILIAAIGGLCTAIVVVFKFLMNSQDRRVAEIAAAHKSAAEAQSEAHKVAIIELSAAVARQAEYSKLAFSDLSAAIANLAAQVHSVWGAFDRMNRLQAIRLSASANIPPEMKDDAAEVLKTIDENRKALS